MPTMEQFYLKLNFNFYQFLLETVPRTQFLRDFKCTKYCYQQVYSNNVLYFI